MFVHPVYGNVSIMLWKYPLSFLEVPSVTMFGMSLAFHGMSIHITSEGVDEHFVYPHVLCNNAYSYFFVTVLSVARL